MKRIDTATKAVDLFGAGKHGFKAGNVLAGEAPTKLAAAWFNHVQEELANLVEVLFEQDLDDEAANQLAMLFAAKFATLAPLADAALTGNPTAPTQAPGNNSTRIANTAFVQAALAALVDSSPATLDTLNELAAALGGDPNFATTMANVLATKAPLASPALNGNPTAPTQAPGNNTTRIATTAFVAAALSAISAASASTPGLVQLATNAIAQAGVNSARAITAENLAATVLGMSQAYQTPSRAPNTTYVNETGRTIFVVAQIAMTSSQYFQVGPNAGSLQNFVQGIGGVGGNPATPIYMPLPPDFACRSNSAAAINSWFELA